jgi:hypothetical protein
MLTCIEHTKLFVKGDHIRQIFDTIHNEIGRVKDPRMFYVLRDVFGYFFEKLLYIVPENVALEIYEQAVQRLEAGKSKLVWKEDSLYYLMTGKRSEGINPSSKLWLETCLKTWHRVVKIFGSDVQEKMGESGTVLSLLGYYLTQGDIFIQHAAAQCISLYAGLNLDNLDHSMAYLLLERSSVLAETEGLSTAQALAENERERLAFLLHKYTAYTRAIGVVVSLHSKDFFELCKDYLLDILNSCLDQVATLSKGFCSQVFKINLESPDQVYRSVTISNAFWLVACLLRSRQKWVSIHLTSLLKLWQNFFTDCRLSLAQDTKAAENYLCVQILLSYLYSLKVLFVHCPLLCNDIVVTFISKIITHIYKSNIAVDNIEILATDKYLLKTQIYEICNNIDMKGLKSIISSLNSTCFNDLNENFSCFYKVPSFLLDQEEAKLIRIFLAESEYYTIAFPDSIDVAKLEADNVENFPFFSDGEHLVIANSKATLRKHLSKAQLIFIGKSFALKAFSRNNKINVLQYIMKNLELVLPLKGGNRNSRALPYLLSLLSIINTLVAAKEVHGVNLADDLEWDNEFVETILQIIQKCWGLEHVQLRLACGLIYAKTLKLAEPGNLRKCEDNLIKQMGDINQFATIIMTLAFMYKYNKVEALAPIQVVLSNILVRAARAVDNEISSNRFLCVALSMGFKYNGEKFLPIFQQCFPLIMLHYLEVDISDGLIFWAMAEWMGVYLTQIVAGDPSRLGGEIKTLLFDRYRAFYPYAFPIVSYARFNLMKAIFACPSLASSCRLNSHQIHALRTKRPRFSLSLSKRTISRRASSEKVRLQIWILQSF